MAEKKKTFEEKLEELESIVNKIVKEDNTLEDFEIEKDA